MTEPNRDALIAEAFGEDPRPHQDHDQRPTPDHLPAQDRDPDPAQSWVPERDDFTDTAQAFFDLPNQW